MKLRAFMIDATRQPETLETYKRIVDVSAQNGFNTIIFRLADDQGFAVNFSFAKDLVIHPDAITEKELRELIRHATRNGIDLIPEIESFGHTNFITHSPKYRHLRDIDKNTSKWGMNGICPVHPQTQSLMKKLYGKIARIFPSKYFHGGCDEVSWGGSALSKKALNGKTPNQIWAEYVNSLARIARDYGKEFMVWGDHILRNEPAIMDGLNKDIIIVDWEYSIENPDELKKYVERATRNGFRIIGAPALIWYKWGVRAGASQLRNIDAYAKVYNELKKNRKVLGLLLTHWCPWRYLSNSYFDILSYAGNSFTSGPSKTQEGGFRSFVENHYGAAWSQQWQQLYKQALDLPPTQPGAQWIEAYPRLHELIPYDSPKTLGETLRFNVSNFPDFTRFQGLLAHCESRVITHHEDFHAFRLSFDYIIHLHWRIQILHETLNKHSGLFQIMELANTIARRDQQILQSLTAHWDSHRNANSPFKHRLDGSQHILPLMANAAKFSARLARQPEVLLREWRSIRR